MFATNQGFGWVNLADQTVELHGTSSLFSDTRFLCIHEAKDGKLWLGTPLNGLQIFDPLTGSIKTVNDKQGLANNTVASITEDAAGDRWLGTYNGVSLVNDQGELITNLYEADGLAHHESNRFAGFHSASGSIYVGTVQGISQINPKKVKAGLKRKEALKVFLTAATYPFSRDSMVQVSEGLGQIRDFILPADNRRLQLNLATSNYIKPNENKYAYRIMGLFNEWIDLGNQPSLMLSNLPAGNYRLEIRGGDGNGNWSKSPLVFDLKVQEFFYRKPWFYLAALLLVIGLITSWINSLRLQVRRATHQIRADKAVIESQATKLQELDHAKNHFFTNISHEFRTPLTIISGMASQITNNPKQWTEKGALLIKRNSDQLLRMVNQIMDLRKLESSRETAQYIQGDVVEFIKFLVESYQNYASGNSITLHFLKEKSSLQMDYDPDKLMKIISNLLSNAVKFTPEGGNIYLQLEHLTLEATPQLLIRVKDTGVGITPEKLPKIFDRYFQVEERYHHNKKNNPDTVTGTGVGLSLTKELVELLEGEILVESEPNVGTTFLVKLPIRQTAMPDEQGVKNRIDPAIVPVVKTDKRAKPINPSNGSGSEDIFSEELPLILVVEDNPDMREYILTCLTHEFQVEVAKNGMEGLRKAVAIIPDIIVSDVMMPEKDGYTLCRDLKANESTSHIPVVLLTAKGRFDARMEGLESGAAAYLSKPFAPQELQVNLKN
ncbi:MAG: ATP-binding protein, partial [Bacteroidota bacterium]